MLLLSTGHLIRLVTSSVANTDVVASYVDLSGSTVTPGPQFTAIASATTTTVVSAPGASTIRTIKSLHIRNRHASTSQTVTVQFYDGATAYDVHSVVLPAGGALHYDEGAGWRLLDASGRVVTVVVTNGVAVNQTNLVVLASDVTNNNGTANTIADVTGLSFPVNAGETYFFRFSITYTAAATTTGSRFSINGPASPTELRYGSRYSLTSTTETLNQGLGAYDLPAAANATSAATGANSAEITGHIKPSASGTVIARFASEVASSAIVAKAGSLLEWMRVI